MKCHYCGKGVILPFKCPFCGEYFCEDHRLPENHECPELWKARIRPPPSIERRSKEEIEEAELRGIREYPFQPVKERWTSRTEIIHLTVGSITVMAVGLSMFGPIWRLGMIGIPASIIGSSMLFMLIFMAHELAHKMTAKHFGLWAEFRLNTIGMALTLISVFSPLIKIVSPGAVMISGIADKKIVGKISLSGPLTNIIISSLLFIIAYLLPEGLSRIMLLRGAILSAWISAFNLIPIGIFDGSKVFWWNKPVWAAAFIISIILSSMFFML